MSTPAPPPAPPAADRPGWLSPLNLLLLAVPAAAALKFSGAGQLWVFVGCGVALIPLAGLLGKATEGLAARLGPTVGGLLNATFGNAAELIIALMMLARGPDLYPAVKATVTGSIIGNMLLVFGLALLAGGARNGAQRFNRTHAGVGATLLAIAAAGLIVPTLFYHVYRGSAPAGGAANLTLLSEEVSVVLIAIYGLGLLFTLRTDRTPAGGELVTGPHPPPEHGKEWGVKRSLAVMFVAVAGIAVLSEWFVGAIEPATHALGMNPVFVGVIVVAIVGNAAEHFTAVLMAWRNEMDIAVEIAVGSSIQVALFVAPVLVFASLVMGHATPMDLHFHPLEIAALALSVGVVALVCHDGESNWLEGAMLLALYLILALAFFNIPAAPGAKPH